MDKLKHILQNEVSGWKKWELCWLFFSCIVIIIMSIYCQETVMGIVSATTGVAYVVLMGKGKSSAYLFGLVNCVLYAIISYEATFYGETMLNVIYYIPMQFVGFYMWSKNMDSETKEVRKRHMTNSKRVIMVLTIASLVAAYSFLLRYMGDMLPFMDSFTTVSSIVAMIISIGMYAEQWWIWIAVDVMSVIMWGIAYSNGNDSIATLLMWIIYLATGIVMCIKWEREIKKNGRQIKE